MIKCLICRELTHEPCQYGDTDSLWMVCEVGEVVVLSIIAYLVSVVMTKKLRDKAKRNDGVNNE